MERTHYPMDGRIDFEVSVASGKKVSFPLRLRVPSWSVGPSLTVNGKPVAVTPGSVAVIDREWSDGDRVELNLPMEVSLSGWYENSVAVERGPLVYALKMKEKWVRRDTGDDSVYGKDYWEVYPESPWNYGLIDPAGKNLSDCFEVAVDERLMEGDWYWNPESAPVSIRAKAKRIPSWSLYNGMAGPQPYSRMIYGPDTKDVPEESVVLIPYGCTTLRISEFPIIKE